MLPQGVAFIQEASAVIQAQVPVQVQVKVLSLEALVILQKVLVQNRLLAVQAAQVLETIAQAVVVKQQKEVTYQYLFQYHLVMAAMEDVMVVLA